MKHKIHIERFDDFSPDETIGAFGGSGQWVELMTVGELRSAASPFSIAVKPLEWTEGVYPYRAVDNLYRIEDRPGWTDNRFGLSIAWKPSEPYATLEAAKAAAQADYETRIRSALLPASAEPVKRLRFGDYPIGTKVFSCIGGHWTRVETGWKALSGDVFPRPGGDAFEVELPPASGTEDR